MPFHGFSHIPVHYLFTTYLLPPLMTRAVTRRHRTSELLAIHQKDTPGALHASNHLKHESVSQTRPYIVSNTKLQQLPHPTGISRSELFQAFAANDLFFITHQKAFLFTHNLVHSPRLRNPSEPSLAANRATATLHHLRTAGCACGRHVMGPPRLGGLFFFNFLSFLSSLCTTPARGQGHVRC